jgi:uncharacterized protein
MNDLLTPGVYTRRASAPPPAPPLLASVAGFVGLAERGPLDSPQRLENWRQFATVFGGLADDRDLGPAVYGFFANGGRVCYVVRAADTQSPDKTPRVARWAVRNDRDEHSIVIDAANAGAWANALTIALTRSATRIELTRTDSDAPAATDLLDLATTVDLYDGAGITLVHATDARVRQDRLVSAVLSGRSLRLSAPLTDALPAGSLVLGAGLDLAVRDPRRTERFADLSLDPRHPRYLPDLVNGDPGETDYLAKLAAGHSILIRATLAEGAVGQGLIATPTGAAAIVVLAEGRDPGVPIAAGYYTGYDDQGYFPPVDPAVSGHRGLATLESVDGIALVALPDLTRLADDTPDHAGLASAQQQVLNHCETLGERFAILDSPRLDPDLDPLAALVPGYIERLAFASGCANGALYFPWVWMAPIDGRQMGRPTPPCGALAGVYARTDALAGVHRSPANEVLRGVLATQFQVSADLQGRLSPTGINCLRVFPGRGILVWGARTLSRDPLWRYVAVRRTLLAIVAQIRLNLQWSVFEPNDERLQRGIAASLDSYLGGLYRSGALAGASPDQAYFVQCDSATNAAASLERGEAIARIGFAPVAPMEFIVATIRRKAETLAVALVADATAETP